MMSICEKKIRQKYGLFMQNKYLYINFIVLRKDNRHSWRLDKSIKTFSINGNLWVFLNCLVTTVSWACFVPDNILLSVLSKSSNALTVCSCHVTYAFQSEYTLYSCLNVKGLLARSRRKIWSLSDWNWTRNPKPLSSNLLNGWVFFYELSGYGFESSCSHQTQLL